MRTVTAAVLVSLITTWSSLGAQVPDPLAAAVHRVFGTRDFAAQRFGPARFIEGGVAYTTVEPSRDVEGAADIVRYDTESMARSVLVSAKEMTPPGGSPLQFDDYAWSADRTRLLLFTNTQKVWRQNTRGDYWSLDRKTGKLTKLGGDARESSLMYAKFSPDASRVGYVTQGDLYVQSLADGKITRLTTGATATLVNGMSDWVYEEEFGLQDGFRWSPDGTRIAYWQFDMSGVGTYTLSNYTDSLYPILTPIQYPKAGTTNSAVRAGIVSAAGGPTNWLNLTGDLRNTYLPWMEWAGPGEIMLQRMNRLQNTNDITMADASTGALRVIFTDRDSAWVDLVDNVPWIEGGKRFLWTSERDGWRHVFSISRDGKDVRLVTRGAFDIVSVAGVDEKGGWLYYIASPDNATQRYLYRSSLSGKGDAARVTPPRQPGTHGYVIAEGGQWAFHTYSSFDAPPVTELVNLPMHQTSRVLVKNEELKSTVAPIVARPVEFFKVPVSGGVSVDGYVIKPRDFDSTRVYPLLVFVYGEPAGQTVVDRWAGQQTLWHRAIADAGYLVMSFDNQGTPAPRGRAWRKIVYGAIGVLSSRQQADAVRAVTRTRRYADSTRVAIWGWSGGGSSTLQAMFRYPDVYQVGMSVAPVPDQRLYDTIYQERYMGVPEGEADNFQKASPITYAAGLRGRLLLVHGSGDDNVHYQGTERLVNELVKAGRPFDFMAYPNRSHCICEGQGTTEHVYQMLTRYLVENLPAGGR